MNSTLSVGGSSGQSIGSARPGYGGFGCDNFDDVDDDDDDERLPLAPCIAQSFETHRDERRVWFGTNSVGLFQQCRARSLADSSTIALVHESDHWMLTWIRETAEIPSIFGTIADAYSVESSSLRGVS